MNAFRVYEEMFIVMQEMQINISIIIYSNQNENIKENGYHQMLTKVWEDVIFCMASESIDQSSHSRKQSYST